MSRPLSRYGYEFFLTLILLVVIASIFYVQHGSPLALPSFKINTKDQSTNTILNTFTGNKTGTTATIVFQTQQPTRGQIIYGISPADLKNKLLDKRDTDSMRRERTTHFFELQGLEPEKNYYVSLVDDEGSPIGSKSLIYEFMSSQRISTVGTMSPIYGHVTTSTGKPAANTVVIVDTETTETLLDITDADGSFLIPLCCMLSKEGSPIQSLPLDTDVSVRLYDDQGHKKIVNYSLDVLMNSSAALSLGADEPPLGLVPSASPAPVLGFQSDQEQAPAPVNPTISTAPKVTEAIREPTATSSPLKILYPENKASISAQPLIKGISPPDEIVAIYIKKGKEVAFGRARGDSNGIWRFSPEQALLPGEYVIDAKTSGKSPLTTTATFTLLKSGEAVLGEATGSATLTPEPQPTSEASATGTLTPSATPSTVIPSVTRTPPISGTTIIPALLIGLFSFFVGLGLILLL